MAGGLKSSKTLDNFGMISESPIPNSPCSKPGERVREARQLVAVVPIQAKLFNGAPGTCPVEAILMPEYGVGSFVDLSVCAEK